MEKIKLNNLESLEGSHAEVYELVKNNTGFSLENAGTRKISVELKGLLQDPTFDINIVFETTGDRFLADLISNIKQSLAGHENSPIKSLTRSIHIETDEDLPDTRGKKTTGGFSRLKI